VPGRNGKIAFTSTRDGDSEIYSMEADGSNQTRLTNNPEYDVSPKWSPDGTKIAFLRSNHIYVMNADGSNQTRLTNNLAAAEPPEWSPDGTRIVFHSQSGVGNSFTNEISVVNADGTNLTQLTNSGSNLSPRWSPDGTRIAFFRFTSTFSTTGIYVMNADGSNQTQLTNSLHDYSPRWSPDGTRITFQSTRDDTSPTCNHCNVEIYSMNADGGSQTRLTNNPAYDASPEWSPDGTRIMFQSLRDNYSNIYVMNADGTSQTRLTNYAEDFYDAVSPIFSPDGTRIMFPYGYSWGGELFDSQIYVMNADGSNLVRLTNTAAGNYEFEPDWQALPLTLPNPIDDPQFFIRQQYRDFLGREPEPDGLAGWLNILNNCGVTVPEPCDRIEVSSAFFRSPEFQGRGYFIYRFYPTIAKVPIHSDFTPDFARVSGFLTDEQLEAAKAAFVTDFMARPEFQSRFASTFNNPPAYVDALLQTVGLPNHPSRQTWINTLQGNNSAPTRAQVLRSLVESTEVYDKYYNEAFVVMQYFGYLRRTADAQYLTWIQTMNQNGGDYRIMINGFMNSVEYRQRFGP
jgi:Tol biopolymer transport system component